MQKNDQLLEKKEQETKSKNFIIHRLEEKGEDNVIKINDAKTTELFFEKIDIEARPTIFFHLGKVKT